MHKINNSIYIIFKNKLITKVNNTKIKMKVQTNRELAFA